MSGALGRGMRSYMGFMVALRDAGAATAHEIAAAGVGVDHRVVTLVFRWLSQYGVVHLERWLEPTRKSHYWRAVWKLGEGVNAPHPKTSVALERPPMRVEAYTFAQIIVALQEGASLKELQELAGIGEALGRSLLKQAHATKLCHIAKWIRNVHGCPAPVYLWGVDSDAARPRLQAKRGGRTQRAAQARSERTRHLRLIHLTAAPIPQPFPLAA